VPHQSLGLYAIERTIEEWGTVALVGSKMEEWIMFKSKEKDKIFQLLLELAKTNQEAGHVFSSIKSREQKTFRLFKEAKVL